MIVSLLISGCQQTKDTRKQCSCVCKADTPVIASDLALNRLMVRPRCSGTCREDRFICQCREQCGYTSQYEQLQAIYERYKEKGFEL